MSLLSSLTDVINSHSLFSTSVINKLNSIKLAYLAKDEQAIDSAKLEGKTGQEILDLISINNTGNGHSISNRVGNTINIKSIVAGNNISISSVDNSLQISSTGSGSVTYSNSYKTSKYQVEFTNNIGVTVVSSSLLYSNLSWIRIGSLLTIYKENNLAIGDRVLINNININSKNALIIDRNPSSITIDTEDSGNIEGDSASFSSGFTYLHNNVPGQISSGELLFSSNEDISLISMTIHLGQNTRLGTTYEIVVPNLVFGEDSLTNDNLMLPLFSVRQDGDALTAIAATISKNVDGNVNKIRMGNLGAITTGIYIILQY